jgi:hypothetical protein
MGMRLKIDSAPTIILVAFIWLLAGLGITQISRGLGNVYIGISLLVVLVLLL